MNSTWQFQKRLDAERPTPPGCHRYHLAMPATGWLLPALGLVLLSLAAPTALGSRDTLAVIVSSSRFWLNYRHTTNAFSVYESIKRQVTRLCHGPLRAL